MDVKDLLTIGQIAERFGEPSARVSYIVGKFKIKPVRRVGIIRLFKPDQLALIRQGLYSMRVDRGVTSYVS